MTSKALIPAASLVQHFVAAPPGKLHCLHGTSSAVFRLSLTAASHALVRGIPIALVDGTNRFDLYYLAEFARRQHVHAGSRALTPEAMLDRIFISRAFTCYQMEAVVTERLPAFLDRQGIPVAIIFGLLDTFYDDQAPFFEVKEGVRRIIAALHRIRERNVAVLLASLDMTLEARERNSLFPLLASSMDRVYSMTETEESPRIVLESPAAYAAPAMRVRGDRGES